MDTPCTDNDIVHSSVRTDSIRMAFTFWLLSLLAASALAQFPPGSISQFPSTNTFNLPVQTTSTFPFSSTTSTSSGFPTFGSQQQQSQQIGRPLATVRAINKAGDALLLTLEEDFSGFNNPFGDPFGGNPFGGAGQSSRSIRVHGIFYKAGAQNGVSSQDSLHGTFAMVVTSNGNTDGFCIGTGVPYRSRSNTALNPYNPAFGNLFGNSFAGNPFGQLFSQGQIAVVSTPLHATTGTATVEGKIHRVRLRQVIGRSIHVCVDKECRVKTDLCGIIGRDEYSVEEFARLKQLALQPHKITASPNDIFGVPSAFVGTSAGSGATLGTGSVSSSSTLQISVPRHKPLITVALTLSQCSATSLDSGMSRTAHPQFGDTALAGLTAATSAKLLPLSASSTDAPGC